MIYQLYQIKSITFRSDCLEIVRSNGGGANGEEQLLCDSSNLG